MLRTLTGTLLLLALLGLGTGCGTSALDDGKAVSQPRTPTHLPSPPRLALPGPRR